MVSYRDHVATTMPLTHVDPGAFGAWQASGVLAPMAPAVDERTASPAAGAAWARRDRRSLTPINPSINDVPGTRPWSPPA